MKRRGSQQELFGYGSPNNYGNSGENCFRSPDIPKYPRPQHQNQMPRFNHPQQYGASPGHPLHPGQPGLPSPGRGASRTPQRGPPPHGNYHHTSPGCNDSPHIRHPGMSHYPRSCPSSNPRMPRAGSFRSPFISPGAHSSPNYRRGRGGRGYSPAGGNDDIRAYIHPSMLEDPWKQLKPIPRPGNTPDTK